MNLRLLCTLELAALLLLACSDGGNATPAE